MSAELRVVPLGGLGEIGLNLLILEIREKGATLPDAAIAIDCGVMFPGFDTPGIDLMIPDLSYVETLGDRLKAVCVTHGHEDHIGGIPFLLRMLQVPIYASPFSTGLIESRLEEHGLEADLRGFEPRRPFRVGPFDIEPLHVTHSIVDACGFAIRTPVGIVVHTGDFKIDHTPVDGRTTDLDRFAALGQEGVLLLLADSTNAERPGVTPSERSIRDGIEFVFRRAKGKVFATTFSSHIHRIQQFLDVSAEFGRRVAVIGRSLARNVEIARELRHLNVPAGLFVDPDRLDDHAPDELTVLVAGSQGEPRSAFTRIATGENRRVRVDPGDAVVLSARVIPGNERPVQHLVNHLYRRGARVYREEERHIHTSGHASREELALIHRLVRPRNFVPVHGEYRHLAHHRDLAIEAGIDPERAILLEDGDTLALDGERVWREEPVPSGRVFVDGKGVGDVEEVVLRDRRHLAREGVVLALLGIHAPSGEIVSGPEIVSRGVQEEGIGRELLDEARQILLQSLQEASPETRSDAVEVQELVRRALKRFFRDRLDRRPMVLPVVLEL